MDEPKEELLYFKTYHNSIVTKTVWYWHKGRHIDQWNRIDSLEIDPHIYGQLVSTKVPRQFNVGKDSLLNK